MPHEIVIVGASAGGLQPLSDILSALPADFPASLFVVLHLPPDSDSQLADILGRRSELPVRWADDQQPVQPGVVYVAPANQHLLVNRGQTRVLFGARESGARPSIDVLFRSAAVAYGSQVVGVVLSGTQDDGARGLLAVKRCGGVAVVLDPDHASEPEMPRNAIRAVDVDYCLGAQEIAPLLIDLAHRTTRPNVAVPEEIAVEDRVAQSAMHGKPESGAGDATEVACPDCGGRLRRFQEGSHAEYRCRVGHAFGTQLLLDHQREQLEQAAWIALRVIGDRQRVLERLAEDYGSQHRSRMAETMAQRAEEMAHHADVLRTLLINLAHAEAAPTPPAHR